MIVFVNTLVLGELGVDGGFVELDCGGDDGYLLPEYYPIPTFEPGEYISVNYLL